MTGYCPDEALFARLTTNDLANDERAVLLTHIESCERCRRSVAALVSSVNAGASLGDTAPSSMPTALAPGVVLGPYHLVRMLGSGSMGTVFAAWDPRLDRQVALKVLHDDSVSLRDEARLMAKLTHPNIVTVYEVAEWQGRLVLVMELVSGGTLRQWLTTGPPVRAIVKVFGQLADALAAAHANGIVHRDFKPDNVLLDVNGRPRLTDFGLGTLTSATAERANLVGTPAYLAPAQLEGVRGDERADQFALSVSLWEALAGERPFRASTLAQLRAVQRAPLVKPAGRAFPRWLEKIVRRGLSLEPADRFPSMGAYARALASGPPKWPFALAAAAAVSVVGVTSYLALTRDPCLGTGTELDGQLSQERRAARVAAFEATGASFAGLASSETNRLVGSYVEQWRGLSEETCHAEKREHRLSGARAAAIHACLELRRNEFESLLAALDTPTVQLVADAPAALLGLRELESCQRDGLDPSNSREQALRVEIAKLRHLALTGRAADVRAGIEALHPRAEALDAGVALAELSWLDAEVSLRNYESNATGRARDCAKRALAVGEDGIASECLGSAAIALSLRERLPSEARAALELAEALAAREPASVRTDVNLTVAAVHVSRVEGQHERSLDLARAAVERLTARVGRDHRHTFTMRSYLAMKLAVLGRFAEASDGNQALLEVMTRTLGEEHPATLVVRNNQSFLARKLGRLDEARTLAEAVLAVRKKKLGARNYGTMAVQLNLAAAEGRLGHLELAEPLLLEVVEAVRRERGADHFDLVEPLEELAHVRAARGARDEAKALLERALTIRRANADSRYRIAATEEMLQALLASR